MHLSIQSCQEFLKTKILTIAIQRANNNQTNNNKQQDRNQKQGTSNPCSLSQGQYIIHTVPRAPLQGMRRRDTLKNHARKNFYARFEFLTEKAVGERRELAGMDKKGHLTCRGRSKTEKMEASKSSRSQEERNGDRS